MTKSLTTLALLASTLLAPGLARADQNTADIAGPVTCVAKDGSFQVTLSADRKELTITGARRSPETYRVTETDGDTASWFSPKGAQAPTLFLDDEGDSLQFNASQNAVGVVCPQG